MVELAFALLDHVDYPYDSETNFRYLHLPLKNHLQQCFAVSFSMFLIPFGLPLISLGSEGSIVTGRHMTQMPLFLSTSYPMSNPIPHPSASELTIQPAVHFLHSCPLGHGKI